VLKRSDNPPMTFPDAAPVASMPGTWWVAHTKSRQEKAFAHELRGKGISYFLPLVEKVTIIRSRKFRPLVPLFPGYVFAVSADPESRLRMFAGNRIARTIPVADQAALVRELTQIQKALDAQATFDPWPYLREGRRARVTSGPFIGIEGLILRRPDITRLILSISLLGQSVALEIDAALLEPV
jgi:transcription antitermination factor NusG